MPFVQLNYCDKIHPTTGYKTTNSPNWPTRAYREPDHREAVF